MGTATHARAQPPQLLMSRVVSTSQPSAVFWLQSEKPGAQMAEHMPLAHVGSPFANDLHTVPHLPQLFESLAVATSQPLIGDWSQSAKPALHDATTQLPATHPAVPLFTGGHAVPHAPQLVTSTAGLTQVVLQHSEPPPSLLQSTLPAHSATQDQTRFTSWQTLPGGQLSANGRQATHCPLTRSQRGCSGVLAQAVSSTQVLGHSSGWALQSASGEERSNGTVCVVVPPHPTTNSTAHSAPRRRWFPFM